MFLAAMGQFHVTEWTKWENDSWTKVCTENIGRWEVGRSNVERWKFDRRKAEKKNL